MKKSKHTKGPPDPYDSEGVNPGQGHHKENHYMLIGLTIPLLIQVVIMLVLLCVADLLLLQERVLLKKPRGVVQR